MSRVKAKTETNAHLLHILSNREKEQEIATKKEQWPGAKRLSLTNNIRYRNNSQHQKGSNSQQRITRPIVGENNILTRNKTHSHICSVKTLSLQRHDRKRRGTFSQNYNRVQPIQSKTSRRPSPLTNHGLSPPRSHKNQMEDYELDYMAFNYIGKVIDSPALWQKYVHKKLQF